MQKCLPMSLRAQARMENPPHAAMRGAANQTTESLLQRDDRLRHAVFVKARTPLLFKVTLSSRDDGIAGNRKRQLVYDHARQLLAAHVNSLPETRGREQHRVRRRTKLLQQRAL